MEKSTCTYRFCLTVRSPERGYDSAQRLESAASFPSQVLLHAPMQRWDILVTPAIFSVHVQCVSERFHDNCGNGGWGLMPDRLKGWPWWWSPTKRSTTQLPFWLIIALSVSSRPTAEKMEGREEEWGRDSALVNPSSIMYELFAISCSSN